MSALVVTVQSRLVNLHTVLGAQAAAGILEIRPVLVVDLHVTYHEPQQGLRGVGVDLCSRRHIGCGLLGGQGDAGKHIVRQHRLAPQVQGVQLLLKIAWPQPFPNQIHGDQAEGVVHGRHVGGHAVGIVQNQVHRR